LKTDGSGDDTSVGAKWSERMHGSRTVAVLPFASNPFHMSSGNSERIDEKVPIADVKQWILNLDYQEKMPRTARYNFQLPFTLIHRNKTLQFPQTLYNQRV
jgi:hypothetical protein